MTDCITSTPGTIGYIDSGHGHAEGLKEIELKNAEGVFVNSKEAGKRGGIMAATQNAGLPDSLDGSFADVKLLNQVSAIKGSTYGSLNASLQSVSRSSSKFSDARSFLFVFLAWSHHLAYCCPLLRVRP